MNRKVIIIGGGGHAKALADILKQQKIDIFAISSPKIDKNSVLFSGLKHFLNDSDIYQFSPKEICLVNGIGSIPGNALRVEIFQKFRKDGYEFLTVISASSIVSDYCRIGMGVQIMPGAIINVDAVIGDNTIVNTGALVEHDCVLGESNHVAPGAVLCGGSITGANVHVGAGASVIQGVMIGENSVIGAGTSVVRNLDKNSICMPAAITKRLSS